MNSLIHFDRISRTYTRGDVPIPAVYEVTLSISSGELVSLIGPSGSGKSTMLNLIGLLDRPTSGSYRLDDREVGKLTDDERSQERCRTIGFIFQSFNLFPMLDVVGNVEVPMFYAGVSPTNRRMKAEELIERVGLSHRRDHRPNELSGGEMQRVAIARALVNDPKLILADEPTGNLDTSTAESITQLLEELHREGRTILIVTHNLDLANRCQRIVRIRDGQLEIEGAAA